MQDKTAKEREMAEALAQLKKDAAAQAAQQEEDKKPVVELEEEEQQQVRFSPQPLVAGEKPAETNAEWQKVVEAYKAKFKKEPDEKGALLFNSREDMDTFFNDQAAEGTKFFGVLLDKEGKFTDDYKYSCGDCECYSGSLDEVLAQLKQKLASPDANKALLGAGITEVETFMQKLKLQQARAAVQDLRKESETQPAQPKALDADPSNEEKEEDSSYRAPSPFDSSTKP